MADDSESGGGLPAPPTEDALELAVAQARIESALFATTETVKLGRYQLLEKVGSGGMGVVWGAWDPELGRRVAIKLVRAERATARDRILLEGQALAKLAHPNVVAVHDVGVIGDQVYIVMEWVRGKTVRAYCSEPRTVRAIVAIFRAAGDGLSAAHRAGLVHRDFKPDNAIVGDDGRVRVLDFGLARGEVKPEGEEEAPSSAPTSDELTRGVGTPRYMPPEQAEGKALTHAADQYALCVSLAEMLRARNADAKPATVPAWIDAIVRRGIAADPTQRFESMDALVRALGRDPASIWRRRLVVGGTIAAAGVAFAIGRSGSADAIEPCIGGAEHLATVWSPTVRARVVGHVASLGPYGASEATRVVPAIETYRDRWTGAHRAACLAQERRELTPLLYERNLACLERSRASYQTVLDVLATVPADRLPDAVVALHGLPDVDRCLDDTRASTVKPPPRAMAGEIARIEREIEQARVRTVAADPSAADALATLATQAERLAYPPLVARALLVHGFALIRTGKFSAAITLFDRSTGAALEAGDDVVFVEAYARQVFATAMMSADTRPAGFTNPLEAFRFALRVSARLEGAAGAFVRPLLFNNVGIAHNVAQAKAEASTWFQRAHDEWRKTRDGSVELMYIPSNLALVTADRTRQRALIDEAAARFAQKLGTQHPFALDFRVRAAMAILNPAETTQHLSEGCTRLGQLHPHLAFKLVHCSYELGWLAVERGDTVAARAAFSTIVATPFDPEAPQVKLAKIQLATTGAAGEALAIAASLERSRDWWLRVFAAEALLVAAAASPPRDAIAALRRAVTILDGIEAARTQPYIQRRLARAQYLLARALPEGAERAQLATAAVTWYREATGYEQAVAELEALTGSR